MLDSSRFDAIYWPNSIMPDRVERFNRARRLTSNTVWSEAQNAIALRLETAWHEASRADFAGLRDDMEGVLTF